MTDNKSKKKRGHGEGSIFQRADGRWTATISYGIVNGKRKRKTVYGKTKKEVQDELTKLQGQKSGGVVAGDQDKLTLGAWLDSWLNTTAKARLKFTTVERYAALVTHHINPEIGSVRLKHLTGQHFDAVMNSMSAKNLSPASLGMAATAMRDALGNAADDGIISRNPFERKRPPCQKRSKRNYVTLNGEQVRHFLASLRGDRLESLFVVALMTGARSGELRGLKWSDIDFDAGTLTIRRSLAFDGTNFVEHSPKANSGRTIHLPALALTALMDRQTQHKAESWHDSDFVWVSETGRPYRRHRVLEALRRRLEWAKLPAIRFHDLRHSVATILLESGTDAKTTAELLGHSSVAITLDVYSHVSRKMHVAAVEKMASVANGYTAATKSR